MKILYIIDCKLNAGGAPRSTCILAEEMVKENDVFILMPYTGEIGHPAIHYIQLRAFKNTFPFIFTRPMSALRLVREIYNVVKTVSPDIIHAEMPRGARAVGFLKKMGYINIPIVYTEREFVTGLRTVYQCLYKILVAKQYDRIICLSKKAMSFWLKYRRDGVVAIPNPGGREYDDYTEMGKREASLLVESYTKETLNVIFVGRYIKTKRWDLTEDIINLYNSKKTGNTHFYIAVAYNDDDFDAKDFVSRMNAIDNVTVYTNADTRIVDSLYYVSDIHLVTSSIESFGRTAIEAMSRKCVVFSTDAGAISETIGDSKFILPADAEAFVKIITEAERDKLKLRGAQEEMYNRYRQFYTTKANYEANLSLYEELLKNV